MIWWFALYYIHCFLLSHRFTVNLTTAYTVLPLFSLHVELGSCRISPPRFLAECGRRRLNQGSFVVLYFVLFPFSGLYLVSVACQLLFWVVCCPSCEDHTTWMTVYSLECADVSLRIYSLCPPSSAVTLAQSSVSSSLQITTRSFRYV